jgi:putative aldouronate transport system substrate-binding protein
MLPIAIKATDGDLKAFWYHDTPEFKEFVTLMAEWNNAGYLPLEGAPDESTRMAEWQAGKYGLWSHLIDPRMPVTEKNRRGWDFVGKSLTNPNIMTTGSVIATLNAVCASSKHPDKAVQYLNLINTDVELYNLLNYGIEGTHWVWVDQAKKLIAPPEGKAWNETGYYPDAGWMWGNNFNAYYIDPIDADADLWAQINKLNDEALPSTAMGFVYDRANVQTEIANVGAVGGEFCADTMLISGDVQACIDNMKSAGIDIILADMQKQLDAFKATMK